MTPPPLLTLVALHVAIAVLCGIALTMDLPTIAGVHPALKPFKFAVSIALLLGSLAYVVSLLAHHRTAAVLLTWIVTVALLAEMVVIVVQALRGEASHYNLRTPFDAAMWRVMGSMILVALVGLLGLALVTTLEPLRVSPIMAFALRAGLWLVLLAAVSGAAMGGRSQHTVGAPDGGPGMRVTTWSTTHGDLRIPHFVALHGLQVLPVVALVLLALPLGMRARWVAMIAVTTAWTALGIVTLVRATAGRAW